MGLFDKISAKHKARKLDDFLSNSLYGLLDNFVSVEEKVSNGVVQSNEAVDFLRSVCKTAKDELLSVKAVNEQVYNRYERLFKIHLFTIEKYINNLSVHHL